MSIYYCCRCGLVKDEKDDPCKLSLSNPDKVICADCLEDEEYEQDEVDDEEIK